MHPNGPSDCVFCAIARDEAPARIVHRTAETIAFFPINPATTGHTLIIPRRHVTDFLDADEETIAAVTATAVRVGRAIREVVSPEGANLITSAGKAATQTVFHLHLHVVPRWAGDEMGPIWPPQTPTPADRLDDLAVRIRSALA